MPLIPLKITGDSSDAQKSIADLRESASRDFAKIASDAKKQFERIRSNIHELGTQLQSTGRQMTYALTLPLVGFGVAAVKAAADMDSLKRGLIAVSGSSEAAEKKLVELRQVALLPGLGFKEAIEGQIRLQAVGIKADVATRALKAFGNAIALTGGGKAELDRVTVQLGQLSAKGKILAQDLRPIIEASPAVATALKNVFGSVDSQEINKKVKSSDEFINKLLGGLEKLPPVTGGIKNDFENMTDTINAALVKVGNAIVPFVSQALNVLSPALSHAADLFDALPESMKNGVLAFAAIAAAAGPVIVIIGAVISALTAAGAPVVAVIAVITAAAASMALAFSTNFLGIRDITNTVLTEVGAFARQQIGTLVKWWQDNLPLIKQTVQTVLNGIKAFWQAHGAEIMTVVRALWSDLKTVISTALNLILGITKLVMQIINKDWAGAWETFKGIVVVAVGGLARIIVNLKDIVISGLKALFGALSTLATEAQTRAVEIGLAIIAGIVKGIKDRAHLVTDAAKEAAMAALTVSRIVLGIHSPSQAFYEVGQHIIQGLVNALRDGHAAVQRAMSAVVTPPAFAGLKLSPAQSTHAAGINETTAQTTFARETARAQSAFDAFKTSDADFVAAQITSEEKLQTARLNTISAQRAEAAATIKNKTELALKLEELRTQERLLIQEHESRIEQIKAASDERQKQAAIAHAQAQEDLTRFYEQRQLDDLEKRAQVEVGARDEYEAKIDSIRDGAFARERARLEAERDAHAANLIAYRQYTDAMIALDARRAASADDALARRLAAHQDDAPPAPAGPKMSTDGIGRKAPALTNEELAAEGTPPPNFKPHLDAIKVFKDSALEAFGGIAQGFGSMLQAFLDGGEISGRAFLTMAKHVLAGIAAQAAVKAIFELAEGWAALANPITAYQAPFHFAAAKIYGLVAGVAAAGALAIPGGSKGNSSAGSYYGSTSGGRNSNGEQSEDRKFNYGGNAAFPSSQVAGEGSRSIVGALNQVAMTQAALAQQLSRFSTEEEGVVVARGLNTWRARDAIGPVVLQHSAENYGFAVRLTQHAGFRD